MEPQLSVVQQVERCPAHMEVSLTTIEPWKGITGAVELWKFEFVGCCGEVPAARASIITVVPARACMADVPRSEHSTRCAPRPAW
jgi:hypothetical protein